MAHYYAINFSPTPQLRHDWGKITLATGQQVCGQAFYCTADSPITSNEAMINYLNRYYPPNDTNRADLVDCLTPSTLEAFHSFVEVKPQEYALATGHMPVSSCA